jgi:endonuclease/exonuclease/phosphatase family metal-dependent hydrolase
MLPYLLAPWVWFLVRDLHPVMDVAALGLPVIAVVGVALCALVALVRQRPAALVTAASWALFGVVAVVGPWLPHDFDDPESPLRIVATNTFGTRSHPPSVIRDVGEQRPDLVVVSEVGPGLGEEWFGEWEGVVGSAVDGEGRSPDVAVLTDLPVDDLGMPDGLDATRGVRARVETPAGPVVLYAMHLPAPRIDPDAGNAHVTIRQHTEIVRKLRDAVAAETLPVVVAGDLNLVDRTSGYRRLLAELDDAVRADWGRPTSHRPILRPLLGRVAHVLMPSGWCSTDASIFDVAGSDHKGVAATIGPCP